jgi:hypothetical protein
VSDATPGKGTTAGAQAPRWTSVSFAGEWPRGVHWTPGETRALPDGFATPTGPLPVGLIEAPAEEA